MVFHITGFLKSGKNKSIFFECAFRKRKLYFRSVKCIFRKENLIQLLSFRIWHQELFCNQFKKIYKRKRLKCDSGNEKIEFVRFGTKVFHLNKTKLHSCRLGKAKRFFKIYKILLCTLPLKNRKAFKISKKNLAFLAFGSQFAKLRIFF